MVRWIVRGKRIRLRGNKKKKTKKNNDDDDDDKEDKEVKDTLIKREKIFVFNRIDK